ncbi:hypothetical protein [Methylobacter sp. BlB1]|nr:hypothetical protein [Methylobacter sp. BlB1]MBF6648922.1 hypothetical protein [Methylobacter sp. BlB1]
MAENRDEATQAETLETVIAIPQLGYFIKKNMEYMKPFKFMILQNK